MFFKKKKDDYIISELKKEKNLRNINDIAKQFYENQSIIEYLYKDHKLYINNEQSALYHIVNSVKKMEQLADSVELQDCNNVLDIGANVGLYSYFLALKYPNANFYIIEADKRLTNVIEKNTKTIKNKKIFELAVSNSSDLMLDFFVSLNSAQTNSLVKENVEIFDDNILKMSVNNIKIDEFCKQNSINDVDVYKIDIQGGELSALESSVEILKNTKLMQIEFCFAFDDCLDTLALVNNYFHKFKIINEVYKGYDLQLYNNKFL